jgi:hypothetical protein
VLRQFTPCPGKTLFYFFFWRRQNNILESLFNIIDSLIRKCMPSKLLSTTLHSLFGSSNNNGHQWTPAAAAAAALSSDGH